MRNDRITSNPKIRPLDRNMKLIIFVLFSQDNSVKCFCKQFSFLFVKSFLFIPLNRFSSDGIIDNAKIYNLMFFRQRSRFWILEIFHISSDRT